MRKAFISPEILHDGEAERPKMTENGDDLRGSTPIYTAKEILQSLDRRVADMDLKVDGFIMSLQIIVSQNLNERLMKLENEGSTEAQEALELAKKHETQLTEFKGMGILMRAVFGTNILFALYIMWTLVQDSGVIK